MRTVMSVVLFHEHANITTNLSLSLEKAAKTVQQSFGKTRVQPIVQFHITYQ